MADTPPVPPQDQDPPGPPAPPTPPPPGVVPPGPPQPPVPGAENTSGQGPTAEVPPEIKGWNWGAFFMNWIWGIGNQVWIALLALIPCANIFVAIWLGISGSEMAWRARRWESVEQFKSTQRVWAIVGAILFAVGIVMGIISTAVGMWTRGSA